MNRAERKRKIQKKMNYEMKKRMIILFAFVLLGAFVLSLRIVYIHAVSGQQYKKQVLSQAQQSYTSRVLLARRGDIYDRNGNLLATSKKVYNVVLDCALVNTKYKEKKDGVEVTFTPYVEPTVLAVTEVLGVDEEKLRTRLTDIATQESQYQIIKEHISLDEKKAFEARAAEDSNVKGIWFEEDYLRNYPFNELACDTIGFMFSKEYADYGVEGYYNSMLKGVDGRQYGYFSDSASVDHNVIQATNGSCLELTIDVGIQQIVEKYVNAFQEAMGAKHVGVIIEDPSTGGILAMDGGDRYNLNEPRDLSQTYSAEQIEAMDDSQTVQALMDMWSNYCVTDAFEPGSTVKPIVMAAALEKGAIVSSDVFLCNGFELFGADNSTMIKCAVYPESHGSQTLANVIANSCNDGMMEMVRRMGTEQFIKTQSLFNFGTRTGIDLPSEGTGIMHTSSTMGETELACSSFGQGFTCTMIQEINALCSVINGGYYYQPHVVSKIKDFSGGTVRTITPTMMKQTISANISADIRSYMQSAVTMGTAHYSKVLGYSSGGKTGTAEKFPRGNGKYLVSFIGFAPVNDPEVVIYVVVDEPNAEDQATSSYAQYIAQGILSELLPYLNVVPDETSDGYLPDTPLWDGFKGHLVNLSGTNVDEYGNLVDGEGNRIDMEGNRIDEEGYLLDENGERLQDEDGNYRLSEHLEMMEMELPEATSDTNIPAPPEDTEEPIVGNDMESDGLTNEEAGLE